jgi:hypothetical protein
MFPDYGYTPSATEVDFDIDLRAHFHAIIYGSDSERPRGQWVVIQKLLRDEKGEPIKSPYRFKVTDEGKHKERGPSTTRTGFLCNEVLVRSMFRPAQRMIADEQSAEIGNLAPTRDVFYFAFEDKTVDIKEKDVVITIDIDEFGNIINPVKAIHEYNIVKRHNKCSDGGRVEYIATIVEDQR